MAPDLRRSNAVEKYGGVPATPLSHAASANPTDERQSSAQFRIVRTLIAHKADVNAQGPYGDRPIHYAKLSTIVNVLLEADADVDAINADGYTALMLATKWGRVDVAGALLDHNANIDIERDGQTVLDMSAFLRQHQSACEQVKELLNAHKTRLSFFSFTPATPLATAPAPPPIAPRTSSTDSANTTQASSPTESEPKPEAKHLEPTEAKDKSTHEPTAKAQTETQPAQPLAADTQAPSFSTSIREYLIDEEMGRGNFAAVFRAFHSELRRHFAIKRFYSGGEHADREIENISRIWSDRDFDSLFLVRFHRLVQDRGDARFRNGLSLVFELCHERSLLQFIRGRQDKTLPFLTAFELLTAAIHLTTGLQALHDQQLVHKDIAPRNIMIGRNEAKQLVFKIGDVGLCKPLTQADMHGSASLMKLSLHTPPDWGQKTDLRSDVFSLGLTLFELANLKDIDLSNSTSDPAAALDKLMPERNAVRAQLSGDAGLRKRYGDELLIVIRDMMSEHMSTRHTAASALHALSQINTSGLFLLLSRVLRSTLLCCRHGPQAFGS